MNLRGPFYAPPLPPPARVTPELWKQGLKPSQTLLDHVIHCGYAGRLYLEGDGAGSHAMDGGSCFHEFAELATRRIMDTGEMRIPGDVARDWMQEVITSHPEWNLTPGMQESLRAMAWNWATGHVVDIPNVRAIETMIELEIDGWIVRGKLDRAEVAGDIGFVHDYKSSRHVPSQERFEEKFQPPFYSLLLHEGVYAAPSENHPQTGAEHLAGQRVATGLTVVHAIEHYPRMTYDETGELVNRRVAFTPAKLADFKETVRAALKKLEHGLATDKWAATPSSHCEICPKQSACPIPQDVRESYPPIESHEQAEEYATQAILLDRAKRGLTKQMRAYVQHEDNPESIVVGDLEFTLVKRESRSIKDHNKLEEALSKGGSDPRQHVKVSASTRFDKRRRTEEK